MKQVFSRRGGLVVDEVPAPIVGLGQVLVENRFSLISSGTEGAAIASSKEPLVKKAVDNPDLVRAVVDMAFTRGVIETGRVDQEPLGQYLALGYSCSGVVVEVGEKVGGFKVGDRVACAGAGYASHAEFVVVPKNLVAKIPSKVSFEDAAFSTLGAIALQGVRRAGPTIGETFVVVGLGLLGQLTVQILKSNGCRVVGVDIDDGRIALSKKMGVDKSFIAKDKNLVERILRETGGVGADGVIVCASSKESSIINQAFSMCRRKGRVVLVGAVGLDLNRDDMYKKELDFFISTSYGPGRYDHTYEQKGIDYPIGYVRWTEQRNLEAFLQLISRGNVNVGQLAEKTYGVGDALKAYDFLLKGKNKPLAVLLSYSPKNRHTKIEIRKTKSKKGVINVGVIGAGSFAKGFHLPNLSRIKDYKIRAIADALPSNAKNTAKSCKADYATTDFSEIINDKKIDMVLVATRHNLHAQIAIDAAGEGKHVFVEKPMALTEKQMNKVIKVVKRSDVCYSVGFNRRYAPFSVKMKEFFNDSEEPFVVTYRVNAGSLPHDHWAVDPVEGGGRIIGEGCHFLDYFNWLVGQKPVNIMAVGPSEEDVNAVIKYRDGSAASLIYTALGHQSMSKERLEVFRAGRVAVIDDYKSLQLNEKTFKSRQDKGQYTELVEFAKKIKGEKSLALGLSEATDATLLSFEVVASLRSSHLLELD